MEFFSFGFLFVFALIYKTGELIYKKSRSEGLFYFTAKKKGTYSFILSNHRYAFLRIYFAHNEIMKYFQLLLLAQTICLSIIKV